MLLQTNPMLQQDLNEVAATLRNGIAPRNELLKDELRELYAARFTEAGAQGVLAFYKSTERQEGPARRAAGVRPAV